MIENCFGFLRVSFLYILSLIMVFPSFSMGQEYPSQPIQLILTWPPGGGSCILATMMAEEAKKYIPQPLVIVYKVGAAGTIGTMYVKNAKPDGYTLLSVRPGQFYAPFIQKIGYSYRDFEIIGQTATTPANLVVKQDAPWKNLREFIKYAKENPGVVTIGNAGSYASTHFNAIRFEKIAGIKVTHVPFKGGAESISAAAGGHIACASRHSGDSEALIESGKVRVLTVFGSKRSKFYPDTPTSKEEGIDLEQTGWTVLMAPKGTPKPILKYWEAFIEKLSHDKAFTEKVEKLKMQYEFKSGEQFAEYLENEMQFLQRIIAELGIKR
jgi:tripartite-type tricarboxylate transporter receptor subunit TctC